jgi:hypothetical protein
MATEYVAAIATTLVLTTVFAYMLVSADIEAIKSNWDTRRCEVPVMITGKLYKPDDDPRSGMEFAKDNFSFCMGKIADNVLKLAFAPFYSILKLQFSSQVSIADPMNYIRGMLKTARDTFSEYMDTQFAKYKRLMIVIAQGWHHIFFAMGRIQAAVLGFVYAGLSLSALIENTINFIIKVVLIFIGILAALIILLWFFLLPVIPTIVAIIAIVMAAGFGAAASYAGAFCVDPGAPVVMADGSIKPLGEIKVGDILKSKGAGSRSESESENRVEGVMIVDATDEPLVSIQGIKMSGSHRVLSAGKWVLARDHPEAKLLTEHMERLICLNTSLHYVPIVVEGSYTPLYVGDWEEVSTEEGQKAWIDLVNIKLNGANTIPITNYPKSVPLVSKTIHVFHETKGILPIESIKIGDSILAVDGDYTIVKGIYKGQTNINPAHKDKQWISDGVWFSVNDRYWILSASTGLHDCGEETEGIYLITEAEMFMIERGGKEQLVRDFTEVGASQIDSTYEMLDFFIHKKSQT